RSASERHLRARRERGEGARRKGWRHGVDPSARLSLARNGVKRARAKGQPESSSRTKQSTRRHDVRTVGPRASFDELEIHCSDGAALRAIVDDPPEGVSVRATLILAHAMFARKSSFGRRDRPGLSSALVERGFRTIAFDFRGHGDSTTPTAEWGYDDL